MNKISTHSPSFTHLPAVKATLSVPEAEAERSHRLIVLIPPGTNPSSMTRRLCKLAVETSSDIQLLGVCKDVNQELALRRELAMVAALIREAKVFVETNVEVGTSWLDAVKHGYQNGDLIVCVADQPIGIRRRPLSQLLESTFKAPIYLLSKTLPEPLHALVISQAIAWSGFLGIMIGFFIMQVKITQFTSGGFQTLLFILSLIPELGLIWVWNSIFS